MSVKRLFVNVAAIPDRNQKQLVCFNVKFVNDSVISHAQFESIYTLQPLMRKISKVQAQFIDPFLNSALDLFWKSANRWSNLWEQIGVAAPP